MEAVIGLLLVLLQVSFGVENHCDGRENNAQCYAALDGSIFIRLMDSAVENHIYKWFKDTSGLLVVNNKHVLTNTLEKRADFTTQNGIYRINQLNSSDSGQYRLEVFVNGEKKEERKLNLSVQAPVSSVQLVPTCLSMGEKKVSCSSKGDSPLYSWTLDGRPLTDSDFVSKGNNTNNVHLKLETVGKLVCHVQNKVSKSSGEVTLTTCGYIFINCTLSNGTDILQWVVKATNTLCVDPTTAPMGKEPPIDSVTVTSTNVTSSSHDLDFWTVALIGISLSALVFILLLALLVICVQKKKPNKPKEQQDDQELTYAAVKVVQRPGTQEVHRSEAEVEYGEVKFSQQPRPIQVPPDDCVYARVCK